MDVDKSTEEGSGVMVEKEDAQEYSVEPAESNGDKVVKKVLEEIKDKVKEPVEGLVEKVKDLAVKGELPPTWW
jgi:hypothetical protein